MGLFNKLDKPVFLKEESDSSAYIAKLTDLLPRATGDVRERIEKEIRLATIGDFGEKNIIFELKNSNMPMYVLHDIHFQHEDLSAQIDFIVVTRFYTFIIECKNLIGDIEIDSNGNFIRSYEFKGRRIKEGIYSPITQNQRHMNILKRMQKSSQGNVLTRLLSDTVFESSYRSVVVLANPKTLLNARYARKEVKNQVIRADQLIKHIKEINSQSKSAPASDKGMKDFAEVLLSRHNAMHADYTKKYEDILNALQVTAITPMHDTTAMPPKTSDNDKLISDLKAFRLKKSREENIKPYYIFNDAQMMDLISKMPDSKEALLNVAGFGQVKVDKYGDAILEILK